MSFFRHSFRWRIITWTVVVSGIVLLAFGILSGFALYRIKIESVDERLSVIPANRFPPPHHFAFWERNWMRISDGMERAFGARLHAVVYDVQRESSFKSSDWPESISLDIFPPAEGELAESMNPPDFPLDMDMERFDRFRRPPSRRRGGDGPPKGPQIEPEFLTVNTDPSDLRFAVYKHSGYNVAIGDELDSVLQEMEHILKAFYLALPAALFVLASGAGFFASRAIKPIRKLSESVNTVSARSLDARIKKEGEDLEFEDLIDGYNEMMGRLERSFAQASRFSADAAHELKTPLTILQGHLEMALNDAPDGTDLQRKLGLLLEETQRLKSITRKLLVLSQADAGQLLPTFEETNLSQLVEELMEDFEMHSAQMVFNKNLDTKLLANIDRSLVSQILQNLLSNAVKYSREDGGEILIELRREEDLAILDVENGGHEIPEKQRQNLFDRFTRLDSARNREVDGLGLGLSLAREFARAHGGELDLVDAEPGRNRFRLTLPLA